MLENGEWRTIKEIGEKIRLDEFKLKRVTEFLTRYNFVKLDRTRRIVKIDPDAKDFLKKTQRFDEKNDK